MVRTRPAGQHSWARTSPPWPCFSSRSLPASVQAWTAAWPLTTMCASRATVDSAAGAPPQPVLGAHVSSVQQPRRTVAKSCPTHFAGHHPQPPPPGSSVRGILQARIPEWVAIPFSRGSSRSRIEPGFPTFQADSLPSEPP